MKTVILGISLSRYFIFGDIEMIQVYTDDCRTIIIATDSKIDWDYCCIYLMIIHACCEMSLLL